MDDSGGIIAMLGGLLFGLISLGLTIVVIAGMWKTYEKAGKPGWGALIPIYNVILLLEIAEKPLWWLILMFIPLVNVIIMIVLSIEIAQKFGKETGFGLGLAFFPFIFYLILGFGDAQYQG